jgi:hypothetical protein
MATTQNFAYDAPGCSSGKVMTAVHPFMTTFSYGVLLLVASFVFLAGCGTSPAPKPEEPVAAKPAEPAVSAELQSAADALLGSEAKVLASGDLAKNGKQQILAANVVPKTPKDNITGTIVTRAVIAQNEDGQWSEVFRCDEHLKNAKGYLGMTPIEPVSGWRLQFEQDPEKGLTLYLTPVTGMDDKHVLPIGVRWNTKTKRYQSLDRTYEQFLLESPTLSNARSRLK